MLFSTSWSQKALWACCLIALVTVVVYQLFFSYETNALMARLEVIESKMDISNDKDLLKNLLQQVQVLQNDIKNAYSEEGFSGSTKKDLQYLKDSFNSLQNSMVVPKEPNLEVKEVIEALKEVKKSFTMGLTQAPAASSPAPAKDDNAKSIIVNDLQKKLKHTELRLQKALEEIDYLDTQKGNRKSRFEQIWSNWEWGREDR